ncbi:MAG: hypothetical protein KKB30_14755 [Proteobacteria bacterium]|nr:hypothetical protein [Pseudomonadota bacterium]MBU1715706.1 hypothetical protein [Pseudomonadota bacterium]
MTYKSLITCSLLVLTIFHGADSAWAKVTIQSSISTEIELNGFNGLHQSSIFKDVITADSKQEIDTSYRGLALLVFAGGQSYPIIIGTDPLTIRITDPNQPPSFAGSGENDFFYKLLASEDTALQKTSKPYDFAHLMLQAKDLLASSQAIHTVEELAAKKKEFHNFIGNHYQDLKHSDMTRRLIAQYFMMHEYIDYHSKGAPATDIRLKYQKEVVNGVGNWLEILKPYLAEQEILNYCVSLYYDRSMVTLASLIIANHRDAAYCPGETTDGWKFSGDLLVTETNGAKEKKLADFKGPKIIAFVSDDCPVSMVETVSKARKSAGQKENLPVIVAPLQKLSSKHLAMANMISKGNIFFINDEKWQKATPAKKIKLPLFVEVMDNSN